MGQFYTFTGCKIWGTARFQQGTNKVPGLFYFFEACIFRSPLPGDRNPKDSLLRNFPCYFSQPVKQHPTSIWICEPPSRVHMYTSGADWQTLVLYYYKKESSTQFVFAWSIWELVKGKWSNSFQVAHHSSCIPIHWPSLAHVSHAYKQSNSSTSQLVDIPFIQSDPDPTVHLYLIMYVYVCGVMHCSVIRYCVA